MRFKKQRMLYVPHYQPEEIAKMAVAGKLVGEVLEYLQGLVTPGISTLELDTAAEDFIRSHGGVPSFKGYEGFPNTICTSVNNLVVHGIPSSTQILQAGDLITIDGGAIVDGWHGDAAISIPVGSLAKEVTVLNDTTRGALWAGIQAMQVGARLTDISHAVESYVAEQSASTGIAMEIVSQFGGHGIGRHMHQEPWLPNYGSGGTGPLITVGSTLCIEPIVTLGTDKVTTLLDGWTVETNDGAWAAHWEHTLVATEAGPRVLTPNEFNQPFR